MATSRLGPEPQRVAVEVSTTCDNSCIFCCREGLSGEAEGAGTSLAARLERAREVAQEVTLVGGEPTLDGALLLEAVSVARARGFSKIGVQTHGRHLVDAEGSSTALLGRLVAAGLTDLHLSIHGEAAAIHDYHVGISGAWEDVHRALFAARSHRLPVAVTTVLTRSNFRSVGELPELLLKEGVSAWTLALPRAVGAARRSYEQVIPRLGMAVPYALRALDHARRRRLSAWIAGAPECLLGPFRRWALAADGSQVFAPACDGCPAKSRCAGSIRSITLVLAAESCASRGCPKGLITPAEPIATTLRGRLRCVGSSSGLGGRRRGADR